MKMEKKLAKKGIFNIINLKACMLILLAIATCAALSGCDKKDKSDLSGIHTTPAESMAESTDAPETTARPAETTARASEESTEAGTDAASALAVRSQIATEKNGKVSIEYPILSNLRDKEIADKVNALLKDSATSIISGLGLDPETDTVSIKCKVVALDRSHAVFTFEGSVKKEGADYASNVLYAISADLREGRLGGFTDYADAVSMAGYIQSDECEIVKPEQADKVSEYLKGLESDELLKILESCDFNASGLEGFPQSFSYENEGDIYIIVPTTHELGDYAIARYSPDTK